MTVISLMEKWTVPAVADPCAVRYFPKRGAEQVTRRGSSAVFQGEFGRCPQTWKIKRHTRFRTQIGLSSRVLKYV